MALDELTIIDRFFRPLAGEGGFSLRDDAGAIAVPPDSDLVVTTDMIAETVHFLPGDPAETVAQKALRVNLSDLAAKGADPLSYTLSLGLPADVAEEWLERFAEGLREDQQRFGVTLLGGDTIDVLRGPVISIAAFGLVPKGGMVHRSGGTPGDVLFVSGVIGAGAAGLALLKGNAGPWESASSEEREAMVSRYRVPEPRVPLAGAVRKHASAAMDISDGLVGDCDKLCAASGCSATIDAGLVPVPPSLKGLDPPVLGRLLTSGDDYEILAAVPPEEVIGFRAAASAAGVPVTRIGVLTEGTGPAAVRLRGEPLLLARRAYVHGIDPARTT